MRTKEEIDALRERSDIVAVVADETVLRPVGASWRGDCPWCDETGKVFYVHPHSRIFHCFGCNRSGDVFSFVMRHEGVPFESAFAILDNRFPERVRTVSCPRCAATGDVYPDPKADGLYAVEWRGPDTDDGGPSARWRDAGVKASDLDDPTFGCGYDLETAERPRKGEG